jgi:2-amino-4-hydroxy-6-hydroxymethyldihydropteridine diphosphokinase
MKHIAYIGIGSNLGDKQGNCDEAVSRIYGSWSVRLEAVSKWYKTKAQTGDGKRQPSYINGAVRVSTVLTPLELLDFLKGIENDMGRPPDHAKWSPRVIDLDILFYDDMIFSGKGLIIPHPEAHKRLFVLRPLCDIEPGLVHPVFKRTLKDLCFEY